MELGQTLDMVFFQKELQLNLRDYEVASILSLNAEGRDKIVPNTPLSVSIRDRNSVMSKNFSSIQLRVWTEKTQDEEILTLGSS